MKRDLETIQADIEEARAWAREYFNADGPDGFLDPPTSSIEFPEPDEMVMTPKLAGRELGISFRYRLAWQWKGWLVWIGKNPMTHQEVRLTVRAPSVWR